MSEIDIDDIGIDIEDIEDETGDEAEDWAGRCYEIATVVAGMIPGAVPIYGHYHGPIVPGSMFYGKPITQHGWVLLSDGVTILDPTRWEFEQVEPYLYYGDNSDYDEGGNMTRKMMHLEIPGFDPNGAVFEITEDVIGTQAWSFIETILNLSGENSSCSTRGPGQLGVLQMMWIANMDPRDMDGHAAEIYRMLDTSGVGAFIPFDNRNMVEQGRA